MTRADITKETQERNDKILAEWKALERAKCKSPRVPLAKKYNLSETQVWRGYKEAQERNSKTKAL